MKVTAAKGGKWTLKLSISKAGLASSDAKCGSHFAASSAVVGICDSTAIWGGGRMVG